MSYTVRFPSMRNMVGAIGRLFNNIKRSTIYPLGSPGILTTLEENCICFKLSNSLGVVLQTLKPSYKPTDIKNKPSKPSYKPTEKPIYHNDIITVPSPGMRLNIEQ